MLNRLTMRWKLGSPVTLMIIVAGMIGGVLWITFDTSGEADTQTDAATASLRSLSALGVDNSPVATVNGVPITKTTLEIHVATADLLGLGAASRSELLQDLVDSELLRQAATAAGVSVSPDEIDAAIRAGLIEPLRNNDLPPDIRGLLEQSLKAQGVTLDSAMADPRLRAAYEGLVLRGRYLEKLGKTRTEILPDLRARASVALVDSGGTKASPGAP